MLDGKLIGSINPNIISKLTFSWSYPNGNHTLSLNVTES